MKLKALGADIFAGLFTHGIKQAGFEVLAHLEHNTYGVATAQLNFPKLDIRVGRENWNEQEFKGKVDFMYTNPPCAAWSTARSGFGGGWETQTHRLSCVDDVVNAGLTVRPKTWCWESVTNAWRTGHQFMVHQAERWNDAGYHCTVLLQDNQYLGVPQNRRRVFLIAHKHPLVWPKLTKPITVEEAWSRIPKGLELPEFKSEPEMQPYWRRLWKLSDKFNGYFRHTHMTEGRGPKKLEGRIPSVMVRKLKLDEVSPVMMAAALRLHPTEVRYVNWHEWLALCGLPMNWKTSCKGFEAASQELARAVMPPVGKWLGKAVADGLKLPPLKGQPTTRLVDLQKPDKPHEQVLFTFEGFTTKPFDLTPPPASAKKPGTGRRGGGKPGSGARIREMILEGFEAEAILEKIHKEFPGSKAKKADVQFHRYHMRKEGLL
jgi:site-specific DNA-cytosine methylase